MAERAGPDAAGRPERPRVRGPRRRHRRISAVDPARPPGTRSRPVGRSPATMDYTAGRAADSDDPNQHCPPAGCSWNNFDPSRLQLDASTATRPARSSSTSSTPSTTTCATRPASASTPLRQLRGRDRVQAQVDDGATTDPRRRSTTSPTATTPTTPSCSPCRTGRRSACRSTSGRAPARRWLALNDVNAADDALIVYHEYTHGMTNRLVTDAGGFPALNGAQPGAMDEGFADWYALDLLNAQGLRADTGRAGRAERRAATRTTRCARRRSTARSARRPRPVPGAGTAGQRWLHLRRLRQDRRAARRCTPTARSGSRRCGTCAPA